MDPADGFGEDHADVHSFDLGALELLDFVWNRIGHHHLRSKRKKQIRAAKTKELPGATWRSDLVSHL